MCMSSCPQAVAEHDDYLCVISVRNVCLYTHAAGIHYGYRSYYTITLGDMGTTPRELFAVIIVGLR